MIKINNLPVSNFAAFYHGANPPGCEDPLRHWSTYRRLEGMKNDILAILKGIHGHLCYSNVVKNQETFD